MCESTSLYRFLDLGFTPPADQFRRKDQLGEPDTYYPLQVYLCDDCGLVQLGHVVSPELLYQNDYPYSSSTTKTGQRHWDSFAESTVDQFNMQANELVVDIGSNVGVLLSSFQKLGMNVHGVDPAPNIVLLAQERGIDTECDFFNSETAEKIVSRKGTAKLVTATNVFAHVDDLVDLVRNIKTLLADDGMFVFEAPYLDDILEKVEYDTIYHEHLSYLSIKPLIPFFKKLGMDVFHIELNDIHGGSFRVYVCKAGKYPISPYVDRLLANELRKGIHSHTVLNEFAESVQRNRRKLTWLLHSLKQSGHSIVGVSAPAKGMTLLNYCGIGTNLLDFVTEKAELKIGRYTPGAHIEVVSDSTLLEVQPDYALLLAWNFKDEIMKNLKEFRQQGGKFIIPIPEPTII